MTTAQLVKESVDCLLCGSDRSKRLHAGLPGVVRCQACGFVYTSPRITFESAKLLYSQQYFESHSSEEMGYDNYVSDRELVERTFDRRLERIEKKCGLKPGRVLDVGCATGFFLTVARKRGWRVNGVEISDYCCRYAKEHAGLDIFCGQLGDYRPEGRFDLITMWDYIEHSFVPDQDIARAYELLKPGGVIAIATPDLGSLPAKIFKDRWIGFKEHEHLYYFTAKNLSKLVRDKGFEVIDTSYAGKYISMDFFAKRVKSYSTAGGAALDKVFAACGLADKRFYCNPLDIVFVMARKPG